MSMEINPVSFRSKFSMKKAVRHVNIAQKRAINLLQNQKPIIEQNILKSVISIGEKISQTSYFRYMKNVFKR